MAYLCPNCRSPVDGAVLRCASGHRFRRVDGVLVLLADDVAGRLAAFLPRFEARRRRLGAHVLDPAVYPRLPEIPADAGVDHQLRLEWRLRRYDLAVVTRLLAGRPSLRVLDVGPWNGWLAHRLAAAGHRVTAADYFLDERDGLRARRFYPAAWEAVQVDLADLAVLGGGFDAIVANRCLHYFPDPAGWLARAREQLAGGGILIATGLMFLRDPGARRRALAGLEASLRAEGIEPFAEVRGYLDLDDRRRLREQGLRITRYPQLLLANLRALLQPGRPLHCFGVWRSDARCLPGAEAPARGAGGSV